MQTTRALSLGRQTPPRKARSARSLPLLFATCALLACDPGATPSSPSPGDPGGKADTGWLSDTSFEVGAAFAGELRIARTDENRDLDTNANRQLELVDAHVKFAKTPMAAHGYHVNQMVDTLTNVSVEAQDEAWLVRYEAVVDMVRKKSSRAAVPTLEDLPARDFEISLPVDPYRMKSRVGERCARDWEPHTLADYNYYYYYAPDKEGCDAVLAGAKVKIETVYPVRTVYPEYDKLLLPLPADPLAGADATARVGFRAAILPASGDDDSLGRFRVHQEMIERRLGLTGVRAESDEYVRYTWQKDGATVIIDLYDPTKIYFTAAFRAALSTYQLVFYNGHSGYGTQEYLAKPDSFSKEYQIITMHSCRSYAYYVRQVLRAKQSEADPTGHAAVDMVATGMSSYPSDSPLTLRPLLQGLMDGISAVKRGEPEQAPTWLSIVGAMNSATWDILYGVAAVRTNSWRPEAAPTQPDAGVRIDSGI